MHQSNIITLQFTGNKFLQSGLQRNKYNDNKSLNHAALNQAVHYATLQNNEVTIYQETIQLAQIKIKFFQDFTYNTDKCYPHLNDFCRARKSFRTSSFRGIVKNFSEEGMASEILLTIVDKENVGILDQLKCSKLAAFQ